jgi:hypothetical protein
MNTASKKLLYILTTLLAAFAFTASCSKAPESQAPTTKQTAKKKARKTKDEKKSSKDAKTMVFAPEVDIAFKAVRNGQFAKLYWNLDTTDGKVDQIAILRSETGMGRNMRVAALSPGVTSFEDTLPNENACWYTLKLIGADNKFQEIGPIRVGPDEAGSADYTKLEDKYKISITRTDDLATLKWDFPEDDYKIIEVVHYRRAVMDPFKGNNGQRSVVSSVERKSQYTNTLPNAGNEYWYWFRITMKSGAIIYRGPIKAEFTRR